MNFAEALDGILAGESWKNGAMNWKGAHVKKMTDSQEMDQDYLFIYPSSQRLVPWVPTQEDIFSKDWVKV